MTIQRTWAMPNSNTFEIKPIAEFIARHKVGLCIDPFANSSKVADITNDLSDLYDTDYHMDAIDFLRMFKDNSVDCVLYDPPYSVRQVSECYKSVGFEVTSETTRASFWSAHKKEISRIVRTGGIVLSFGWNTNGMGKKNGFEIDDILIVAHGGPHNDTLCVAEIKQ